MNPTWVFAVLLIIHSVYGIEGDPSQQTLTTNLPLQANGGPIDGSAKIDVKGTNGQNDVKSRTLAVNNVLKAINSGTENGPDNSGSSAPAPQQPLSLNQQLMMLRRNKINNSLPHRLSSSTHNSNANENFEQHVAQSGSVRRRTKKGKPQMIISQNANSGVNYPYKLM